MPVLPENDPLVADPREDDRGDDDDDGRGHRKHEIVTEVEGDVLVRRPETDVGLWNGTNTTLRLINHRDI